MKKVLKQVVGIDIAQDELVVCLGKMYDDLVPELVSHKTFSNDRKAFSSLTDWVKKLTEADVQLRYVMEATGVYHERLAYFLVEEGLSISIIMPNKISNYARTLSVKTVTDKTASEAIAMFGLERKLDDWTPPKGIYKKLQQLCRERNQLVAERTIVKNQLHSERAEAMPNKKSIERATKRITLLDKQEKEIKQELADLVKADAEVKRIVLLLCTIPGIGVLTAATVLGETNGFELIRNKRQLASYAGFDVKEKQSGTSIKSKPCISKRGNKQLRRSMHFPALAAIRSDERFKAIFVRLVSKHGIKMKAVTAIQRKLLEMTYTIYKTGKKFEKDYLNAKVTEDNTVESIDEKLVGSYK
jgi:transposase